MADDDLSAPVRDQDDQSSRPRPAPAATPRRRGTGRVAPPEVSDSIAERLQELEQRVAADLSAPPGPAPRRTRAMAPRSAAATPPATGLTGQLDQPQVVRAPRKRAAPTQVVRLPPAAPAAGQPHPASPPAPPVYASEHRPPTAVIRGLLVAAVLLLATAAGLGTAAVVKGRPSTWQARTVVTLQPAGGAGSAGDGVGAAVERYRDLVQDSSFTTRAAERAQMPDEEVREDVNAEREGTDAVEVIARTSSADGARALANAAGLTLLDAVGSEQQTAAGGGVGAVIEEPSSAPTRTAPSDRDAALAGAVAAAAVVLIALVIGVLARALTRRRENGEIA